MQRRRTEFESCVLHTDMRKISWRVRWPLPCKSDQDPVMLTHADSPMLLISTCAKGQREHSQTQACQPTDIEVL
jgi:hypothetical protein